MNSWAFTGNTSDGRAGHFTIDKPRERPTGSGSKVVPLRHVPDPSAITLARLAKPPSEPPEHWPNGTKLAYGTDGNQWVKVVVAANGSKRPIPHHKDSNGKAIGKAGPNPWPLWCEKEAIEQGSGQWIAEAEGEKCANWLRAGGLVAVSQPGHDHNAESIKRRYSELLAAGVAGVAYLADNDSTGDSKAKRCATAAAAAGLPFLVIRSSDVWPVEMPAGGSIDDAWGTAAERVDQFEAHLRQRKPVEQRQEAPDGSGGAGGGRRVRLAPDDVLARLPEVLGEIRQNIRTGDVMSSKAGLLTGNQISRLYLELSSSAETWPKDVTADAVMLLASRNSYDPVAEYLDTIGTDPLPLEQWQRLDQHLLGIDDPIAAEFLPRYLIGAVARVFAPGASVRQSPVLVGPQWRGKTAMGRILFGAEHWVSGVGDLGKDALERVHTAWGVELAELDGITRRSDQESLKAFLTETSDTYRRPYDRAPERHLRRFVFWGTSNGAALRDTTGNTRFVTIPIPDRMLPLEWAAEHRNALWARAVEQYRAGTDWDRCSDATRDAIADRNANYTEQDPWHGRIFERLERKERLGDLPVSIATLLDAVEVPMNRQGKNEGKRVRQIAESLGWVMDRRRKEGSDNAEGKVRGLWPPKSGHNRHNSGHNSGHNTDPSQRNGSAHMDTTDTTEQQKAETAGQGQPAAAASSGAAPHRSDTFQPFAVSSRSDRSDPLPPNGSARTQEAESVVSAAEPAVSARAWLSLVLQLRAAHPGALPAQLANLLQAEHGISASGRDVKAQLAAWDQQQQQEAA